jgi:hypothetical protein
MLGLTRCGFHKKRTGTQYAELVFLFPMESVGHVVHCGASGARNINVLYFMLGWARCGFITSAPGHISLNLCSAFWCVWDVKHRCIIFRAQRAHNGVHKKRAGTLYTKLVYLHPGDLRVTKCIPMLLGHEPSMHYFSCLCGLVRFHKKHVGTRYTEPVFLYPMGSVGYVVQSCAFPT